VLLLTAPAHAAGWYVLDKGACAFGRGGANVVDPGSPAAVMHNPAGLAGLPGLQLMVDGDWVLDRRSFARNSDDPDGDGRLTDYDRVENGRTSTLPSPAVFMSYNFASLGLEKLTLGLGVSGPPRVDHEWPADGAQRYSEVEYHALEATTALAAAYELPWWKLRLGVAGLLYYDIVDIGLSLNTFLSNAENPLYDGYVHARTTDAWTPGAAFGISAEPMAHLGLALTYQWAHDVRSDGVADEVSLARGLKGLATVTGDQAKVDINLPAIFRAAARYTHPDDSFNIEGTFVWEGWHRNDVVVFNPENIVFSIPTGEVTMGRYEIPMHWRDTYSVRLGSEVKVLPDQLSLRAGGFYERSAVPKKYLSAFSFDVDKAGATLGAHLVLPGGMFMDVASGYVYGFTTEVANSDVRLANPLKNPITREWPIGNGRYANRQIMVMMALGVALPL